MRLFAGSIVAILLAITLWNFVGTVALPDVSPKYIGTVLEGSLEGATVNAEGVALVKDWVENRTRPSIDPVKIIGHQFWYNAITKGYRLKMWMEPFEYLAANELYGIYQQDNYLVLRIEYRRRNRVLVPSFSAEELEQALQPYVVSYD
jgi:hypothetical protein